MDAKLDYDTRNLRTIINLELEETNISLLKKRKVSRRFGVYFVELMPCNWRKCDSITNVQQKMEQIQSESSKSFRIYRLLFVEQILKCVLNENKDIDRIIAAKQCSGRICSNDSCSEPDLCGSKVVKKNMPKVELSNTETLVTAKENSFFTTVLRNDAELKVGEPVMANPNSYDSVKLVWL